MLVLVHAQDQNLSYEKCNQFISTRNKDTAGVLSAWYNLNKLVYALLGGCEGKESFISGKLTVACY